MGDLGFDHGEGQVDMLQRYTSFLPVLVLSLLIFISNFDHKKLQYQRFDFTAELDIKWDSNVEIPTFYGTILKQESEKLATGHIGLLIH